MEPVIGAEPTTSPLPRVCSTTELHGLKNRPQTNALIPFCLLSGGTSCLPYRSSRVHLERETGLEPATLCLEGRYSSQLSYSRNTIKLLRLRIKWWTGKDSNLRRPKPADLQSAPFSHSGTCPNNAYSKKFRVQNLELVMGLEPATC